MNYENLIRNLENHPKLTVPIFIPSRTRSESVVIKSLLKNFSKDTLRNFVFFVVVSEEYTAYKESLKELECNILIIPEEYRGASGGGLDSTRKFIFDFASYHGLEYIYDVDDDIEMLSPLYNAGLNSRKLRKQDREKYAENIFAYGMSIFQKCCEISSDLCLGSFCYNSPNSVWTETSDIAMAINKSSIVRTMNLLNVKRMKKYGIERKLGEYDRYMEDVGINLNTISHGGSLARMQSIVFTCPSHVKLPRTELKLFGEQRTLADEAYEHIKNLPFGEYIVPATFLEDGTLRTLVVDWKRYNREQGDKSQIIYLSEVIQ